MLLAASYNVLFNNPEQVNQTEALNKVKNAIVNSFPGQTVKVKNNPAVNIKTVTKKVIKTKPTSKTTTPSPTTASSPRPVQWSGKRLRDFTSTRLRASRSTFSSPDSHHQRYQDEPRRSQHQSRRGQTRRRYDCQD